MQYHERERKNKKNKNCVHIVYLFAKLCNIFDEASYCRQYKQNKQFLPFREIVIPNFFALKQMNMNEIRIDNPCTDTTSWLL